MVVQLALVAPRDIGMAVRRVVRSRHGRVHRMVRGRRIFVLQAQFDLAARARNRTEHGRSDRTPDGEQ